MKGFDKLLMDCFNVQHLILMFINNFENTFCEVKLFFKNSDNLVQRYMDTDIKYASCSGSVSIFPRQSLNFVGFITVSGLLTSSWSCISRTIVSSYSFTFGPSWTSSSWTPALLLEACTLSFARFRYLVLKMKYCPHK